MMASLQMIAATFLSIGSLASLTAQMVPPVAATNAPASTMASTNTVESAPAPAPPAQPSLYDLTVNSIDGKPVNLNQFRGKVALVVNTASHCGFTPQYVGLEKLYQDYKDKGFVVLAFPCNDFGHAEPDASQEIAKYCATKFSLTFPMFEKVKTRGDGQSSIYQFLATGHGPPTWNFHKYLVDKNGKVIAEFQSQINPDSKEVRDAIEAALKG